MDFCPRCQSVLLPKIILSGTQEIIILTCKRCGYRNRNLNADTKLEMKTYRHTPKQMVAAIGREQEISTESTIPIECPNCGNNTGFVWQVQTRSADESSTQFIRCTRCGFTYREST